MDLNKTEILVVENASIEANLSQIEELNALQLLLVGGGIGETVL